MDISANVAFNDKDEFVMGDFVGKTLLIMRTCFSSNLQLFNRITKNDKIIHYYITTCIGRTTIPYHHNNVRTWEIEQYLIEVFLLKHSF